MCVLRSASPIHVQYLKNMGVQATLVVSLMVGGNLWGLISCHHYEPRNISFETKSVCEVLAEIMATRIAQRIIELYSEAELAVVPSLYEGFSLPAIEAMACAVPLVATTGGALPEVVGPDGESALTVEPGDAQALAAKIALALDDGALRARVGAGGRRRVLDRWTWAHTATGTVEQYQALLEDSASVERHRAGGRGAAPRYHHWWERQDPPLVYEEL